MEMNGLSGPSLKAWLRARDIPVGRFAAAARLHVPEAYNVLNGYEVVGEVRGARIRAAIEQLERETAAK